VSQNSDDLYLDPILKDVVHKKAKRLVGLAGLTETDVEDIEQHLYAKLVRHFSVGPKDSPRGALLDTTVDRALASFLRDRQAQKRESRTVCSLSLIVDLDVNDDDRPIDLAASITERENAARYGRRIRTDQSMAELKHDVAVVIQRMSERDADLCERLMHESTAQVSRDLGIPASTVYDRIRRIRERYVDASLAEYL
jgi:RNA polymerase sigma-70 factor (ECF subfamily)